MKKNIVYITIMVMATIIMIASVAGCNTSCNNKVPYEKEPITGEVIATSEVDGSKVAIIETEIDGVKVTETSIVTDDKEVKIGETITTSETTETTVAPTTVATTAPTTTTTTTKETEATPTPKPNYTNNDINFGNDESAASEYQGNNGGTVETTAAPTATPEPTATPVPTATPEPTATPTPEPTEAPTEPEPQTEYKTVTVYWDAADYDNNKYSGSISGVGVHRDPGGSWKYDNAADVKSRVKADIGATIPGGFDECASYGYSF